MNEKEKATAVLNYLEDCDSETVINLLTALIPDEKMAGLYDQLKADGIDVDGSDKDSGDGESETVKEALDYVRDGLGEEDLTIYRLQVTKNMRNRQPAWDGVDDVRVMSLLEEYGEENGLSDEWWEAYGDINDWLEKL